MPLELLCCHTDAVPDLDAITDPLEREATVGIIHNCEVFKVFGVLF